MMIKGVFKSLAVGLLITSVGCSSNQKKDETQLPDLNKDNLNVNILPGDNFYTYANTKWMESNPIPDDKSRYGSFDQLAESSKEKLRTIFNELNGNAETGTVASKIADFYKSGMDTLKIEKDGIKYLESILAKINSIENSNDLVSVLAYLHSYQLAPLFYFYSTEDSKNSEMTIAGIYQNGLGLPDRDYYLLTDESSEKIKAAYKVYLQKLFAFSGENENEASRLSSNVYNIEEKLAISFYTKLQNRDPHLTYNKIQGEELNTEYSGFDWDKYFASLEIPVPAEINISQVSYLKDMINMLNEESIEDWKAYLKVYCIRNLSDYLGSSYVNASFELYGKLIQGKQSQEPRWKRVQSTTNGALGEALGQLFVEKYFPPKAKERMEVLVENLRFGFEQRINQLEWMSDETKAAALEKLKAITVKIGYPNKWRDYSDLEISSESYVQNVLASNRFDFEYSVNKIGKPVDKEEWHMFPQTVNAYYNPSANEIVFPAAILQPPFFYMDGDDAVNYGAIGVVIGHEMTHGFDDQGAKFDKDGNLNSWWSEKDAASFAERTKILVEQFNKFPIVDTLYADGEFTLGENIADLGGLNIAWEAYNNAIQGKDVPLIAGLNDKERFFLGYAAIWAQNIREKEMIRRTKTDPHSLGKYRVNGPLPNMEQFYQTFNVTESNEMYIKPEERANIW